MTDSNPSRPAPWVTRDSDFFWEAAKRDGFVGQRCADCGRLRSPPRPMCPDCQSVRSESQTLSGRGTVVSWVMPRYPVIPGFPEDYIVVVIDLEEGIRFVSNLCEIAYEDVEPDLPVEVFFVDTQGGYRIPLFRPAARHGSLTLAGEAKPERARRRARVRRGPTQLDRVAIAGIGNTEFSKNSGRSELQLAAECIQHALDDAGLAPADVDGMVTFTIDNNEDVALIRNLGVDALSYSSRVPHGGGGSGGALVHAAGAIVAGLAEVVVVWRAMNERSEYRFGSANASPPAPGGGATGMEWSVPWGAATPACWQSMLSQRYMIEYGVRNEDLALLSILMRKHAANNPNAFGYRRPIRVEDHQNSKWIVEPVLRLLDCCQESDGGQAFVLTSLERARDLKQPVVRIRAGAQHVPNPIDAITNFYQADFTEMVSTQGMAAQLYEQSGIAPEDIQVAQLYDHFSPILLQHLEAWRFCGKGEAMDFVRDGHCELDGRLPVNTHGGLIGEAYIHGLNSAAEAVRQVRGSAINQVPNVQFSAFSSGMTGLIFGPD